MKELFTLYYHRRILFTDFFSQSRKTPIYQKSHVNYSELLQLVKGWSNLVSNRIIIWRLPRIADTIQNFARMDEMIFLHMKLHSAENDVKWWLKIYKQKSSLCGLLFCYKR